MQPGPVHEAIKPLSWLIGKWKSVTAEGMYPTIKPFVYCEELEFSSLGQPLLNYSSRTWHPQKKTPMHLESGYLRAQPGTNKVAFMVAHNFGLCSLEEGEVVKDSLELKSNSISRMSFAKDPAVTLIERSYKLNSNGRLVVFVSMATTKTSINEHLKIIYERC